MSSWIINGVDTHGGKCFVSSDRFDLVGPGGRSWGNLKFPMIGRPHIATGDPSAANVFEPDAFTFGGELAPEVVIQSLRDALGVRFGLRGTGNLSKYSALTLSDPVPAPDLGSGMYRVGVTGPVEDRILYDVVISSDETGTHVAAPHAVYFRSDWSTFGLVHITDIHVARRIDGFQDTLIQLGRQAGADQMYNWNDRFRGFIKYANYLQSIGAIDAILATGDIYDYIHEKNEDSSSGGNALFLREILLGQSPGRPPLDSVEELKVPIFLTLGNHDYRKKAYPLRFVPDFLGIDLSEVKNYSGFNLNASDALAITRGDNGTDVPNLNADSAAPAVDVDETNEPYSKHLADLRSYLVRFGHHTVAMLDSAWDVGVIKSRSDAIGYKVNSTEDQRNFVDGSPNSRGIESGEVAMVAEALNTTPDHGLVILGLHAPLLNTRSYPYYLRESQRAFNPKMVYGFLASAVAPFVDPASQIRQRHETWFASGGGEAVSFQKRKDPADSMDYATSRGKVVELLNLVSGKNGNRPADVLLHGHIHIWNEMRIGVDNGELAFFTDFYTMNPARYYPAPILTGWKSGAVLSPERKDAKVYVSGEAATVSPPVTVAGKDDRLVVFVPPYGDPLNSSPNPREWWLRHRPLVLQTEAYGPLKNAEVDLGGFRILSVKDNVIERIHTVRVNRLHAAGYSLSFEQAVQPEALTMQHHFQRSAEHGSPKAKGIPFGYCGYPNEVQNIVYRDEDDRMIELWRDSSNNRGNGNLTDTPVGDRHPRAAGDPFIYFDNVHNLHVLPYRAKDGHIHSLYWGTDTAKHDSLSKTANAPKSAGNPVGCFNPATNEHVVMYRAENKHLRTLYWMGQGAVGTEDPTGFMNGTPAAGDPDLYLNPGRGMFIAPYRGTDGHIRSVYWTQATPYGEDNLSGTAGTPKAGGDPRGYYLAQTDVHQVAYRGEDGHIHEIYWVGDAPAQGWSPSIACNAPKAAGNPYPFYVATINTKHLVYRGEDKRIYDLSWNPGGQVTVTDLTEFALAPAAKTDPRAFVTPKGECHVFFVGEDDHVHEIRFGEQFFVLDTSRLGVLRDLGVLIGR